MANPLTDKQFVRLLDDRLDKVYWGEYGEGLPPIIDSMYNVINDSKAWLEYYQTGDIPDPEEFNGIVQYQSFSPGYHTKIEPKEYAGGLVIQRRLLDTERYDIIENMAKKLGAAAKRKMNKMAHEPFIYADSTAFSFMTSEEGVALCSDSHTTKSGTSTTSGFDNLTTLAFDAPNLETMRIMGKQLRSDISERIDTNFDTIIHSTALAEDVWNVLNATGQTDSANNDLNFQKGKWKSIELPYLDDFDTNDWFIVDSSKMKEHLKWINSVALEFANIEDFDTLMRKYRDYFVVGLGFTDWRWIIQASAS